MKIVRLTKKELIEKAKDLGFFNKKGVDFVWGRENGHFYYTTPPKFIDGLESYKITREDVEGGGSSKLSAKDAVEAILACENEDAILELYIEGKIVEGKESSTVLAALETKKNELSPSGE